MVDKTGNHRDHRRVRREVKAKSLLQFRFAGGFSTEMVGIKGEVEIRVGGRIIVPYIDTIHDTRGFVRIAASNMLKAVGKVGVAKFFSIAAADGGQTVAANDSTLGQVDVAVVLDDSAIIFIQGEDSTQNGKTVAALILDIVDGIDRPDSGITRIGSITALEVNHRQGALPVVGVENIGEKVDFPHHIEDCHAKEGVPFAVVILAVEGSTLKIILVVEKIPGHPILFQRKQAAVLLPPSQIDGEGAQKCHFLPPLGLNLAVKGHHNANVNCIFHPRLERCRQRTQHIAQPSAGRKGSASLPTIKMRIGLPNSPARGTG